MKKALMALAAVAAMTGFCGNQDAVLLTFSTKGPDAYRTGETVANKECYALVWTKAGETFGGFDAAGNVLGNGSVLIVAAPIASASSTRSLYAWFAMKQKRFLCIRKRVGSP